MGLVAGLVILTKLNILVILSSPGISIELDAPNTNLRILEWRWRGHDDDSFLTFLVQVAFSASAVVRHSKTSSILSSFSKILLQHFYTISKNV